MGTSVPRCAGGVGGAVDLGVKLGVAARGDNGPMMRLALTSPGNVSTEERSALVRACSCGWRLDRVDSEVRDEGPVAVLASAALRIVAHDGGRVVGAAAVIDDAYASRLFDEDAAQLAVLAAESDEVRRELLAACCRRMESERWARLYFYEFDGAVRPSGADSLGFEHLDDAVLWARRTSVLPPCRDPVAEPSAALEHEVHALLGIAREGAHAPPAMGSAVIARARELDADTVVRCMSEGTVLVARHRGVPIGFVTLEHSGCSAYIRLLAVDAGSRRQGVGASLLQAVDHWAGANEVAIVAVATPASNSAALGLYERSGFSVIDRMRLLRWRSTAHAGTR